MQVVAEFTHIRLEILIYLVTQSAIFIITTAHLAFSYDCFDSHDFPFSSCEACFELHIGSDGVFFFTDRI